MASLRRITLLAVVVGMALVMGPEFRQTVSAQEEAGDAIAVLVARLELERYKSTIKGLTQFGDRRQGTQRNREAVDWIEAQLEAFGCAPERLFYTYDPAPRPRRTSPAWPGAPHRLTVRVASTTRSTAATPIPRC